MSRRHVYTIPASHSFCDVLAGELWRRAGEDPVALSRNIVLVPNHRAARVIGEAFLRVVGARATLLPEISAVGDIDEDNIFADPSYGFEGAAVETCPPAIASLRRQLLLTQLVLEFLRKSDHHRDHAGVASLGKASAEQAARLAAELARLVDQMQTEGVAFESLKTLVPEEYAEHWGLTLAFLNIVGEQWPKVLKDEGAIDPAQRRDQLLSALAERWRTDPPGRPVTIAGSTGTVPATAKLMHVISGLPNGAVVLPGLDLNLDEESWQAVQTDGAHPQHTLARLLGKLEIERADVALWTDAPEPAAQARRLALLGEAMRPAETTDSWLDSSPLKAAIQEAGQEAGQKSGASAAVGNFARIDCANINEEASVIALLLREQLECPGRRAALITPDRSLARRVKSELSRWQLVVDDSAGQALADTPALTFWRLTAEMVAEGMAPVLLLASLKHPLAAGGERPATFRARVRALERMALRGPRPGLGLGKLLALLDARASRDQEDHAKEAGDLAAWLRQFADDFDLFEKAMAHSSVLLTDLLIIHNRLVERLAASDEESGAERLWRGDSGGDAAQFLADLHQAAKDWPPIAGRDYLPLLGALLAEKSYRPRYGTHPRLAILGPLEGRLQSYERVIIGGLNEGSWPPEPAADPWLSRPMQAKLGLPAPEVRVGQAAHDFVQACGGEDIFMTRSIRVDGTPTVPSRWLMRLSSVLEAMGARDLLEAGAGDWLRWQAELDKPGKSTRRPAPEPRPPLAARPRQFSVTQIETWMRNPYAIYARNILKLRPLDPIDVEPGVAERGTFIHAALDRFIRDGLPDDPDVALSRLLKFGQDAFGDALHRPTVKAFWWPRFEKIAAWFVAHEWDRREGIISSYTEMRGKIEIPGAHAPVTLVGTADRIDCHEDGSWTIIDYKTGLIPTRKAMESGAAPQLPLEALMLHRGGFGDIEGGADCRALDYWRLTGGEPAGKVQHHADDVAALVGTVERGLEALIAEFDREETPYLARPNPALAPRFDDYAHLARIKEWAR